ncbi:unnamed protein product [Paramecium primaurelia]|uniref:Transmembrane protein n=1 Tax=Paramecium primaurelia TaxID=5886 RepID=A0A8S1K9S5_PARPR|nr:unnamed protein product [Paramecium primaurelia]
MLGSIGFLFFCIYFIAEGIEDLVFPLDNFQFRLLQWIDCKTKEQVEFVDVEGQQQISIQKGQGICLDHNYQLPLYEDNIYNYTFIFNRPLFNDELFIFIDYKMYNLSIQITGQSFIQIQHQHFLTCMNSIELWLNSTVSLNLIFIYIAKVQTNTKDQVLFTGQLPQFHNNSNFNYNLYQNFEMIIKNKTLQYKTIIPKFEDKQSVFCWFKLYLDNILLPSSISQIDLNNSIIQGNYMIQANNHIQLNELPFLIKINYQLIQMSLISQIQQTLNFEAIIQIDQTFSQLNSYDTFIKQEFKQTNYIRMLIDVTQVINNTFAKITVLPKDYKECVKNIYLSNAKINIKNEQSETILECQIIDNNENQTCINYDNDKCLFQVNWQFENNKQYLYELSGILKKSRDIDPYIYFKTEIEYFPIMNIKKEINNRYWIGYLLLINLLLPILLFLFCVFCIISLKFYHPYIMYIIQVDEICFQSQVIQKQQSQQSIILEQSNNEGGNLIQENQNQL